MFSLTWVVEYCCCDKCNTVVIVLSTFDISCRFVQLKPSLELAVFVSEWSFWRDFTLQTWFMSRSLLGVRMSELHDLLVTLCIKLDKVTNLKLMLIIIDRVNNYMYQNTYWEMPGYLNHQKMLYTLTTDANKILKNANKCQPTPTEAS